VEQTDLTPTQQLAKRLNDDRLARRMSWPVYAKFLGESQTTIYKIASGQVTKAHELTIVALNGKLDANQPQPAEATAK
jgi:hypothetical protein